jgi:hypothetical protein
MNRAETSFKTEAAKKTLVTTNEPTATRIRRDSSRPAYAVIVA